MTSFWLSFFLGPRGLVFVLFNDLVFFGMVKLLSSAVFLASSFPTFDLVFLGPLVVLFAAIADSLVVPSFALDTFGAVDKADSLPAVGVKRVEGRLPPGLLLVGGDALFATRPVDRRLLPPGLLLVGGDALFATRPVDKRLLPSGLVLVGDLEGSAAC